MLEDRERRRFMRLSADTRATIMRLTTRETAVVKLIDLSACGCAFYTTLPIKEEEKLAFVVNSPDPHIAPFQRYGVVSRLSRGHEKHLIAVDFVTDPK